MSRSSDISEFLAMLRIGEWKASAVFASALGLRTARKRGYTFVWPRVIRDGCQPPRSGQAEKIERAPSLTSSLAASDLVQRHFSHALAPRISTSTHICSECLM